MGWRHRYGNPDRNQPAIVDLVRPLPASVEITTGVGDDFPDIVVGFQGLTVLVEIKAEDGKLTKGQERFQKNWRGGPVLTARSGEELVQQLITLDRRTPPVRGLRSADSDIVRQLVQLAGGRIVDKDDLPALLKHLLAKQG